jgi:4-hydroxybenzoate polyprenyltransferase
MLLIDVLTLAGLYTVRILAGATATGTDISFWLLAFSIFFFLSLALVKRHVELANTPLKGRDRVAGRGYRSEDLAIITQSGLASAFAAVLVLALYIDSAAVSELYARPWMVWPLAPMVLYITLRIWVLTGRNEMHDDPVVFIAVDWRSQLVVAAGAILLLIASLP